jgi:hypothetical protein
LKLKEEKLMKFININLRKLRISIFIIFVIYFVSSQLLCLALSVFDVNGLLRYSIRGESIDCYNLESTESSSAIKIRYTSVQTSISLPHNTVIILKRYDVKSRDRCSRYTIEAKNIKNLSSQVEIVFDHGFIAGIGGEICTKKRIIKFYYSSCTHQISLNSKFCVEADGQLNLAQVMAVCLHSVL